MSESVRQSLAGLCVRGKSGLHRTRRQVTPGGREPTESATESIPPHIFCVVRVKGCGKSAPQASGNRPGKANPAWSKAK